ncbi:hypothetical protein GBA52_028872 [Prunus armeniaca]|nr:hypothetical protein GBA52_028872 [Prunus armeniaca]
MDDVQKNDDTSHHLLHHHHLQLHRHHVHHWNQMLLTKQMLMALSKLHNRARSLRGLRHYQRLLLLRLLLEPAKWIIRTIFSTSDDGAACRI